MRKTLLALCMVLLLPAMSIAAKQTLNNGAGLFNLRTVINENFTELYDKAIDSLSISGTTLTITFDDATTVNVDLSTLKDGIGTDDQAITDLSLSGNIISLTLENGGTKTVDLTSILGSGGLADAPSDGTTYGRKDGVWIAVGTGTGEANETMDLAPTLGNTDRTASSDGIKAELNLKQDASAVIPATVGTGLVGAVAIGGENDGKYVIGVDDGGIGATQLASTDVAPGVYTSITGLTVDSDGRITSITGAQGTTYSATLTITGDTTTGYFTANAETYVIGDSTASLTGLLTSSETLTWTPESTETVNCTAGVTAPGVNTTWTIDGDAADMTCVVIASGSVCADLGYTASTESASTAAENIPKIIVQKFTATCAGQLDTIATELFQADTTDREVIMVVYNDHASTDDPGTVAFTSGPLTFPATSSSFAEVSVPITTTINLDIGDEIWIGWVFESVDTQFHGDDNEASGGAKLENSLSSFAAPDPWNTSGDSTSGWNRNIWVTYK